jgi:hypothetical protein
MNNRCYENFVKAGQEARENAEFKGGYNSFTDAGSGLRRSIHETLSIGGATERTYNRKWDEDVDFGTTDVNESKFEITSNTSPAMLVEKYGSIEPIINPQ